MIDELDVSNRMECITERKRERGLTGERKRGFGKWGGGFAAEGRERERMVGLKIGRAHV